MCSFIALWRGGEEQNKKYHPQTIYTVNSTRCEIRLSPRMDRAPPPPPKDVLTILIFFPGFLVNRTVKAVASWNPVIVMKAQLATGDALLGPVATHPIPRPVR